MVGPCLCCSLHAVTVSRRAAAVHSKLQLCPPPYCFSQATFNTLCFCGRWKAAQAMLPSPCRPPAPSQAMQLSYLLSATPQCFADKVVEESASDTDFVWIHDYHLLVLPR